VAPAIDHGWLVPIRGRRVVLKGVDFNDIRHGMADFDGKSAGEILREERPLHEQCGMIAGNHKKPAAVFCSSIPHATDLRHMLARYGITASLVHSKMLPADKAAEMKAFESGEVDMVINVATLVAGWDSLRVAELHILRPTFSLQRYLQIAGRALRPAADSKVDSWPTDYLRKLAHANSSKPFATIVDYTDTHRFHRLCSSIDVVASTPRTKKYREKLLAAAEEGEIKLDEIDAMAAAEERLENERARAEQEAERNRRRHLVVGVTFDAKSSDPFSKPTAETPKRREARMLWGPFKGEPLRLIPRKELERIVRGMKRSPGNEWLVKAIKRELEKGLSHG
jgi:superfamily II DNA or RNA helicase